MFYQNPHSIYWLWTITLSLVAITFFLLIILVLKRLIHDKITDKRNRRKDQLTKILLIHQSNPFKQIQKTIITKKYDRDIIAEIALDLLAKIKGNSSEQLKKTFEELSIPGWIAWHLTSGHTSRKILAIKLAHYWLTPSIQILLINALKKDHPKFSLSIIDTLSFTQNSTVFKQILPTIIRSNKISFLIAGQIFKNFGSTIQDNLTTLAQDSSQPNHIQQGALWAIAQSKDFKIILPLANTLHKNKNKNVRILIYYALSLCSTPIPDHLLLSGITDPNWNVRMFATICSSHISPIPAKNLIQLLDDPNWLVGFQAAKTIYQAGPPGQLLLRKISEQNNRQGYRAKMILQEQDVRNDLS